MIRFDVLDRFCESVQFTAEIECSEDAPRSVKLGLAVKWAVANKADLTGANLTRADLTGANLSGANLSGADLTGADLSGANLSGANLSGVNLTDANLTDANLSRADLIAGASRSDGYRFLLVRHKDGSVHLQAGCRRFTLPEARAHWQSTRAGTPLGDETFAILDHLERVAVIRGWIKPEGAA